MFVAGKMADTKTDDRSSTSCEYYYIVMIFKLRRTEWKEHKYGWKK
jgi:hypothetical protein